MYHLLKGQQKPRVYHGVYYPLNESEEPGPGATDLESETKMGAVQEQRPEPGTEPGTTQEDLEPVYTIVGEPVIPTEEGEATTIVLDLHPATVDDRQDEGADEAEQDRWSPPPPIRRRLAPVGWSLVGMALVLVGVLVVTLAIPWFETSATVTIVPWTLSVSTTFTVQFVPGNADLARQQVQGRQLATLTMSQSKTVPATGSGYQPAQAAQGRITLYNALPSAQTIPAGTLLVGQDGTQVTTDTTVTIPAGQFSSNGQITVSAQDIKGASAVLATSLTQNVTAAYQADLQDGESLLIPVSCQAQVQADHPRGSEAKQVTVNVSERCQGIDYNTTQMQTLVSQALNRQGQARGNQAAGYRLTPGSLHIQATPSSTRPGAIQIQARGTLRYQWSAQQQRALAALIVSKREAQAITLLEHQPGIATVAIQLNGRDTGTLPDDPGRIQFMFVTYGQ